MSVARYMTRLVSQSHIEPVNRGRQKFIAKARCPGCRACAVGTYTNGSDGLVYTSCSNCSWKVCWAPQTLQQAETLVDSVIFWNRPDPPERTVVNSDPELSFIFTEVPGSD